MKIEILSITLVDIQSGQHFLETIPLRNLLPGE